MKACKDRRAALDKVRREPEALIAPVNGVIAEGVPVAGQIAQPNAVVFQIVDPARLWVEALSFDARCRNRADAIATTTAGRTLPLAFRGSGHAERNQSIPVQFQIEGDVTDLRAGLFVTVFFKTDEEKKGIAVPRASVIRASNGQEVVYVHTAPEQFEARAVRVEPLDGERVLVAAGLDPAMRIVGPGRRTARSRAVKPAMFTFLVTRSLRNRLLVLAMSLVLVVFGSYSMLRLPVDVLPDLNRGDRHHHDGGGGPGAARGRAAGQLPDRDADERRARRHAGALDLGRRLVVRLRRVRLGH